MKTYKLIKESWERFVDEGVDASALHEAHWILSDEELEQIEAAIEGIMDDTKKSKIMTKFRELQMAAGKRAGHESGEPGKPGSKLHKAGKAAGADLDEGMGMAEKVLHAGVLATWLAGAADAAAHGDPTAPAIHVLDAMYEIAKDMPADQEINAATFAKHFGKKLVGMGPEQD